LPRTPVTRTRAIETPQCSAIHPMSVKKRSDQNGWLSGP
jgi:hypothetical protein